MDDKSVKVLHGCSRTLVVASNSVLYSTLAMFSLDGTQHTVLAHPSLKAATEKQGLVSQTRQS